jgi:hypothetical protein
MNYKYGSNYSLEQQGTEIIISDKKQNKIIIFRDSINDYVNTDAIISLNKIPVELTDRFTKEKKIWFDIEGKRTFCLKNLLWIEIKDFFSRYGIRFEIES